MTNWVNAESKIRPATYEETGSGKYFVRRNLYIDNREDAQTGEKYIMYCYEEAKMNAAEYAAYMTAETVESKREAEIVDEYTMKLIDEGVL